MLTNSPDETFEPVSVARRRTWQFGEQQVPHAILTAADGSFRPESFVFKSPAFFAFGAIGTFAKTSPTRAQHLLSGCCGRVAG